MTDQQAKDDDAAGERYLCENAKGLIQGHMAMTLSGALHVSGTLL
jgi:hypothetical protein